MQLRNFIRRHKWRLRPLKRFVLPIRNAKRGIVRLFRNVPTIEQSTRNYRGLSSSEVTEIFPAVRVQSVPNPVRPNEALVDLRAEPALLYHLRNIDFWARYGGSIVTRDNKLLADLSPEVWGVENQPRFSQLRLPKPRMLSGKTAIAVTPEAPGNYYHWLIDLVPRVALVQVGRLDFDRLLINGSRDGYESASLTALKIPREKILYVDAGDRFAIDDAVIPSMDHSNKAIAPWKIEMLRSLHDAVRSNRSSSSGRLYISRRGAAVRRVINESEFEPLLRDANFSIVQLESMPWSEQVASFGAAKVVLAPHGAALANIAFCAPDTLVAEIGTQDGYKDFYLQLANAARLRYRFVEAQPRVTGGTNSFRAVEAEDMLADLAAIRKFLGDL